MPKRGRSESGGDSESSDDDIGPSLPPPKQQQAPPAQASAAAAAAPRLQPPLQRVPTVPVTAAQLAVCAEALPTSLYYERSYLHRDIVTHVAISPVTDFLLTASADGCLKFWRKRAGDVTFVKVYRAHQGEISVLACSHDGVRAATAGDDGTVKLFDIASFDMQTMAKLAFLPGAGVWCYPPGAPLHTLALADRHAPTVHLLDGDTGAPLPWGRVTLHTSPVLSLAYSPLRDTVVSGDAKGVLECWSASEERALKPPPGTLAFSSKLDTDLFALARAKATVGCVAFHPAGTHFAATSAADGSVRVFRLASGACCAVFRAEELLGGSSSISLGGGGGGGGEGALPTRLKTPNPSSTLKLSCAHCAAPLRTSTAASTW